VVTNLKGAPGISFDCTGTGNTVINNIINDADWGITDIHGTNTLTPNSYFNVNNVISSALPAEAALSSGPHAGPRARGHGLGRMPVVHVQKPMML
jgi:hypothetical protein